MITQYVQNGHCASSSRSGPSAAAASAAALDASAVPKNDATEARAPAQAPADDDDDDDVDDDDDDACAVVPSARCTSSICTRRCSALYTAERKSGRIARREKSAPHDAPSARLAKQHANWVAPRA